jgi:hypothetical protein
MIKIPDHPIQRKIILTCDDGHPPPELKFFVAPEINLSMITESAAEDGLYAMQAMVLVYRYDERIGRDTYQYLFVGGRIE